MGAAARRSSASSGGSREAEEDQLFLAFAHGYEFDYGTGDSNWDRFRRICETAAKQPDLTFCSLQDVFTA